MLEALRSSATDTVSRYVFRVLSRNCNCIQKTSEESDSMISEMSSLKAVTRSWKPTLKNW